MNLERKTLRRWNNAIHRDTGYFFLGMTLIYAISGIVLNHFKSGDFAHPDYAKSFREFKAPIPKGSTIDQAYIDLLLKEIGEEGQYKSHVMGSNYFKVFLKHGSVLVDMMNGSAVFEKSTPRYLIKEFNLLHYNNIKKLYTWYSDLYAVAMILLGITGLFVLRGKNGIKWRGAVLAALGIIVPAIFLLIYT